MFIWQNFCQCIGCAFNVQYHLTLKWGNSNSNWNVLNWIHICMVITNWYDTLMKISIKLWSLEKCSACTCSSIIMDHLLPLWGRGIGGGHRVCGGVSLANFQKPCKWVIPYKYIYFILNILGVTWGVGKMFSLANFQKPCKWVIPYTYLYFILNILWVVSLPRKYNYFV